MPSETVTPRINLRALEISLDRARDTVVAQLAEGAGQPPVTPSDTDGETRNEPSLRVNLDDPDVYDAFAELDSPPGDLEVALLYGSLVDAVLRRGPTGYECVTPAEADAIGLTVLQTEVLNASIEHLNMSVPFSGSTLLANDGPLPTATVSFPLAVMMLGGERIIGPAAVAAIWGPLLWFLLRLAALCKKLWDLFRKLRRARKALARAKRAKQAANAGKAGGKAAKAAAAATIASVGAAIVDVTGVLDDIEKLIEATEKEVDKETDADRKRKMKDELKKLKKQAEGVRQQLDELREARDELNEEQGGN